MCFIFSVCVVLLCIVNCLLFIELATLSQDVSALMHLWIRSETNLFQSLKQQINFTKSQTECLQWANSKGRNSILWLVVVSFPGQLTCSGSGSERSPKLWVALSGGRVVVFDATSWSILQDCIMVGEAQLVRQGSFNSHNKTKYF